MSLSEKLTRGKEEAITNGSGVNGTAVNGASFHAAHAADTKRSQTGKLNSGKDERGKSAPVKKQQTTKPSTQPTMEQKLRQSTELLGSGRKALLQLAEQLGELSPDLEETAARITRLKRSHERALQAERYENALNEFRARHRKRERDRYRQAVQKARFFIIKPVLLRQLKAERRKQAQVIEASGLFDASWYVERHPEAQQDPIGHYLWKGVLVGADPHPLFDTKWYIFTCVAVRKSGENPLIHYLTKGWKKKQSPHPWFDVKWYLAQYRNVADRDEEPLRHFLSEGWLQDKKPHQNFDVKWYKATYKDALKDNENPLIHYLARGQQEGFLTKPSSKGSASSKRTGIKKKSTHLKEAYDLSLSGDHAAAINLAESGLSKDLQYSVDILRSNAELAQGNESGWLSYLNRYLGHFNVAPVQLSGSGSLIERLSCEPPAAINEGPLVSVLMPAWNAQSTVAAAANSILNQTWRNIELIIVDDASDDGTWDILNEIASKDTRVKVLRNISNVGPYVSKNIALAGAKGEFVTGHDADDWAHPERLAEQARFLLEGNKVSCLSSMLRLEASGQLTRLNKPGLNTRDGATRTAFISLMIRRRFLRHCLGGWDDVRFGADSELIRRQEIVTGRPPHRLFRPTMFCFDNPNGLTNHPVHGFNERTGKSESRVLYSTALKNWHANLKPDNSRIAFPHRPRRFPAPESALNPEEAVAGVIEKHRLNGWPEQGYSVHADVIIATDLTLPGGNASTTIDEFSYFIKKGLIVNIINCPRNLTGKNVSPKYAHTSDLVVDHCDVVEGRAKILIIRNPIVASASSFIELAPKLRVEKLFFVKNNSVSRPDGQAVYDPDTLIRALRSVDAVSRHIAPIGPLMRSELNEMGLDRLSDFNVVPRDWTPTFDLSLYHTEPKRQMTPPFRIGRHGRDGAEKWLSDAESLRAAYPASKDFRICILGGANHARKTLGTLPENWEVHPFGSVTPLDYLENLDVFVYYPDDRLSEGFGRTVVEAMIAGVPCVLPHTFQSVFGRLAVYAAPFEVKELIRRMAQRDKERITFLHEVQSIAAERFATRVIGSRFERILALGEPAPKGDCKQISAASMAFRERVMEKSGK